MLYGRPAREVRVKIDPDAAGMSETRLERITEHFGANYVDTGKIAGCQITVVRGGHVAYYRSLGLMDRERGIPMADDTIFRIFSMTKPIASIALMQLYERGMFQLLDPVRRYIPEWQNLKVGDVAEDGSVTLVKPHRPINVRDLLMHTSGLPNGRFPNNPIDSTFAEAREALPEGQTLESVTSLLAEHPLKFHPGTHWNYGLSTDIVGRLVEILSGQRFDEYLQREIFDPLGMVDTGFFVPEAQHPRLAALYQYRPANTPRLMEGAFGNGILQPRTYLSGAGGLVSTTHDYVAFCQMLANGGQLDGRRVLGRKTLELMTVNHLPGGSTLQEMAVGGFGEAGFDGVGFGLGFAVGLGPAATAMAGSGGEFYWGGAASTAFWVDPVEDLFVVFMTQLYPSATYPFRAQLRALVYQAIDD
jgi:CubicO group peptidase (beta-lactamase class C family)